MSQPNSRSSDGKRPSPRKEKMTPGGVVKWLLIYFIIMATSYHFVWSKTMIAFGGFDFTTLQSVPTGETYKDGRDVTKSVLVDPSTKTQSHVTSFDRKDVSTLMWVGCFGAFLAALYVIGNPQSAPVLGMLYAGLGGLALGGFSARCEMTFPGFAMQAVVVWALQVLVTAYIYSKLPMFRASEGLFLGFYCCCVVLGGLYLLDFFSPSLFGSKVHIVPSISAVGIGFSALVFILAARNLIIVFDAIDNRVREGVPKYMEAYWAFSIFCPLRWLYIEVIRLQPKIRSDEDD
jgi:uncharacterized YccA/Bax inhibitor family protein